MRGRIADAISYLIEVALAFTDAFTHPRNKWDWDDIQLELDEWEKWTP